MRSRILKEFIEEIQFNNRNPQNIRALNLLDDKSTNTERVLSVGTYLYRCRIIADTSKIDKVKGYYGYGPDESFVPPRQYSKDMRANYRYIPYLYCSNHPYISAIEVRPRLSSSISVATIKVIEPICLLDLTGSTSSSKMIESKQNLFSDLSELYSKPVTDEDNILDYIPTQFIAEYVKKLGYDGIAYKSSLTPEINDDSTKDRYNTVIFNYDKCIPIKSNVFTVTNNYLDLEKTDVSSENFDISNFFVEMLDSIIGGNSEHKEKEETIIV